MLSPNFIILTQYICVKPADCCGLPSHLMLCECLVNKEKQKLAAFVLFTIPRILSGNKGAHLACVPNEKPPSQKALEL